MQGLVAMVGVGLLLLACGGKTDQPADGSAAPGPSDSGHGPVVDCWYDGVIHPAFEAFPGKEPCTTCSCIHGGGVFCLPPTCTVCEQAVVDYGKLLVDAKSCQKDDPDSCSQRVSTGLSCGCDTFVNPSRAGALEQALAAQQSYADNDCAADVTCAPCQVPESGWCNAIDQCVDRFPVNPGAACQVAGSLYPSGSSDVPSLEDCNHCTCVDGVLGDCTLIGCTTHACPEGTRPAGSCVECGAAGKCSVVEYSCRPTCTDRCADGVCQQGVCIRGCGP